MMMCWNVDIATYIHLKWFSSSTRIATEKNKRWERIAIRGLSRPRGLITQQHAHSNMCLQLEMETAVPTYALILFELRYYEIAHLSLLLIQRIKWI